MLYNYSMRADVFTGLIVLGVAGVLAWRAVIAARVGLDARQRGFPARDVIRWALIAVVGEDRYWWGARLDRLPVLEARELLIDLARAHNLLSVVNVRCPLCSTEIKHALAAADNGDLYVHRHAACSHCDFRVDACRHCAHFLPASASPTAFEQRGDFSHGRCGVYRAVEPVRTAYPQQAGRMEALGYDMLPTPKPIADSFIPLPECTAFTLNLQLLQQSHVPWLNRQRVAVIHLHQRVNHR